ncbi:hypothetical protein D3C76_1753080 [compost metagenome]
MLRFNAETDMLVGNLDYCRQNVFQIIDVYGCSIHCVRKCGLLTALCLVGVVEYV